VKNLGGRYNAGAFILATLGAHLVVVSMALRSKKIRIRRTSLWFRDTILGYTKSAPWIGYWRIYTKTKGLPNKVEISQRLRKRF